MNLTLKIKEQIKPAIVGIKKALTQSVYVNDGVGVICEDKLPNVTKTTKIVAEHINENLDNPIDFPRFKVTKTSALNGMIGMHSKVALVLDTDDDPTEGSKNLLTSGTIFNALMALQNLIDEIKDIVIK